MIVRSHKDSRKEIFSSKQRLTTASGDKIQLTSVPVCTLDKLGALAYFAKFSLDRFINGPSGLVSMDAWEYTRVKMRGLQTSTDYQEVWIKFTECSWYKM